MRHFTAAFLWTFCALMFAVHVGRVQERTQPDPKCLHAIQAEQVRSGWDLKGLNLAIREAGDSMKRSASYPRSQEGVK